MNNDFRQWNFHLLNGEIAYRNWQVKMTCQFLFFGEDHSIFR